MFKIFTLAIAASLSLAPALAETPVATETMTKAQARERLAACGAQWQQMKRNGTDGSQIWREFSKICMSGEQPRKEKASPTR